MELQQYENRSNALTAAKVALAYLSIPKETMVMCIFKTGRAILPKKLHTALAMIPHKGMQLDGDEYKELRDKYFNQTFAEMENFIASTEIIKHFLKCRLLDAKRLAIKGKPAPNVRGKQYLILTSGFKIDHEFVLFLVFDMEANGYTNLLDYERRSCYPAQSRPLVVNFGSCS